MGQPATIPALCELARARRPDVIFLFETLSFRVRLEVVRVKRATDCCLSDILLTGYNFTWFRGQDLDNAVEERLDHAMGNPGWHTRFLMAVLHNLVAPVSNHNPILLDTDPVEFRLNRKSFCFENRWLQEPDLKLVVRRCWSAFHNLSIMSRLSATGETLVQWGRRADSNFRKTKRELEARIDQLQSNSSSVGRWRYNEAKTKLVALLANANRRSDDTLLGSVRGMVSA
ncbi:hypothetical protein ACS0TY_002281 [Phlomoides rotata]